MVEMPIVLAHRGWDEILLFAVPVVLLYLGIRWWDDRQQRTGDGDDDVTEDEA